LCFTAHGPDGSIQKRAGGNSPAAHVSFGLAIVMVSNPPDPGYFTNSQSLAFSISRKSLTLWERLNETFSKKV
jgi:hypothetical protein